MEPTPLQKLRHNKGWRLTYLYSELKKKQIPISWPTLVKIDNGYKSVVVRNAQGKITQRIRQKYVPNKKNLKKLAKLFKVKPEKIYSHRNTVK